MSPDSGFIEKCAYPGCFRTQGLRSLVTKSGRFKLCPEHYEQAAQRALTAFMPKVSKVGSLTMFSSLFWVVVRCCSLRFSMGLEGLVFWFVYGLRRVSEPFVRLEIPCVGSVAYGGYNVG